MTEPGCRGCRHCVGGPGELERQVPGLNILSSAFGATRAETAFCRQHDVFLLPGAACPQFAPRDDTQATAAGPSRPAQTALRRLADHIRSGWK